MMDDHPRLAEGAPTVDELKEAYAADPDNAEAASRLGWELYSLRHYKAAIEVLEAAQKLAPDDAEIAYVLGLSLKQFKERTAGRSRPSNRRPRTQTGLTTSCGRSMLKRMAQGQANFLKSGDWEMEPPA